MEERAVGGKEKKYVLYTVVNDDKARAGFGVWMVRILLGSLLLVALAVVPYVSLRLAQVNDRTLVVFQPIPVHNHSRNHHHKLASHRPGGVVVTHLLQSAALVKENYTTEVPKPKKGSNATLVTLHESAVTLSLLEDTNNITHLAKNQSIEAVQGDAEDTVTLDEITVNVTSSPTPPETKTDVEETKKEPTPVKTETVKDVNKKNLTSDEPVPPENSPKEIVVEVNPTSVAPDEKKENLTPAVSEAPQEETSKLLKVLESSSTTTTTTTTTSTFTTSRPTTKFSSSKSGIIHKLAYVATASSGNHVGGICMWKTNKNVTKWSYFYDNIPIEFQSHQDSTDHEMKALLAAVRLWSDQWHDYHVVLRSQHQAIQGSKHQTRLQLGKELNRTSEEHFTYELEWRQRKNDSLMGVAHCLANLHRDYKYWFNEFEQHVDELLGAQDWSKVKDQNRLLVPQKLFVTDHKPETEDKIGDLASLSLY